MTFAGNRTPKMIVIGYGYIGSRICGIVSGRRRVSSKWQQPSADLDIVAVVEPDHERANRARTDFPNAQVVDSVDQLSDEILSDQGTFIRDFSPASNRHALLQFAEAKNINILLEKPLTPQCLATVRSATPSIVGVGMSEVHNPVIIELRHWVQDNFSKIAFFGVARANSVQTIRNFRSENYRNGLECGAFVDKMIHDLHLIERGHYTGQCATSLNFDTINEAVFNRDAPEDIASDITLQLATANQNFPVRLIASWCGLPPNLDARLGIDQSFIENSVLRYKTEDNISVENLKIAVVHGTDLAGQDLTLIANLQSRHDVSAGIWMISGRSETFREIRFGVSILTATDLFSRGEYTSLDGVKVAHEVAFECANQLNRKRRSAARSYNPVSVGLEAEGQIAL